MNKASTPNDPKKGPSELKDGKVVTNGGSEIEAPDDEGRDEEDKESPQGESEESPYDPDDSEDENGPSDTSRTGPAILRASICSRPWPW